MTTQPIKWDFFIDNEGYEWEVAENIEAGGINATCEVKQIQIWIDTNTGDHEVACIATANFFGNCMPEVVGRALALWRVKYPSGHSKVSS
jgi:hypothetical protein